MTTAIAERIQQLKPDAAQGEGSLRLVPILGPSHEAPAYRLLEDEILDSVIVTEINMSGSVPELKVTNNLDVRVLLIDGQELIGAKQNRILNTDVLVPPKQSLSLPVSCVEQRRWGIRRDRQPVTPPPPGATPEEQARYETLQRRRRASVHHFVAGKSASFSTRRRKSDTVHRSLTTSGGYNADQQQVWDEVQAELTSAGVTSNTQALSDLYIARERELTGFRANLRLPYNAVGLAVFHGGVFQGLDVFDRHTTLKYFWESLVDSYALSWLNRRTAEPATNTDTPDAGEAVLIVLDQASKAAWAGFDSPGEGRDYRLRNDSLTGSSLVFEEKLPLHLQVFGIEPGQSGGNSRERAQRPSIFRRYGPRHRPQSDAD